ncbi:MAG: transposase [Pseudomonadota bacterium]|nr:transposase [Pseudomonadota bacterium]
MEIDDAYLEGERADHIHGGRGALDKTAFVAAVQTDEQQRPQRMRLTPVAGFTNEIIRKWAAAVLEPEARVVSDGTNCFAQVQAVGAGHERHVTGGWAAGCAASGAALGQCGQIMAAVEATGKLG